MICVGEIGRAFRLGMRKLLSNSQLLGKCKCGEVNDETDIVKGYNLNYF